MGSMANSASLGSALGRGGGKVVNMLAFTPTIRVRIPLKLAVFLLNLCLKGRLWSTQSQTNFMFRRFSGNVNFIKASNRRRKRSRSWIEIDTTTTATTTGTSSSTSTTTTITSLSTTKETLWNWKEDFSK